MRIRTTNETARRIWRSTATLALLLPALLAAGGCAQLLIPDYGMAARHRHARRMAAPPPLPVGRWDNVMRLERFATIDVLTADGAANVGPLVAADAKTVTVLIDGSPVQLAKADVIRVDLVALPGSVTGAVARRAARGALLGAGAVALVTGVIGGPAWPPPGVAVRAGVAAGGLAGGQAAIAERQGRILYVQCAGC